MTCEHKISYEEGIYLVCVECGELTENMDPLVRFDFTGGYSRRRDYIKIRHQAKHCTFKYFEKFLKNFDFDEKLKDEILTYFYKQESILKDVLKDESRKKQLGQKI